MRLRRMLRRSERRTRALELYARLVEQGRRPAFYACCGVPDTVDGRFDMIVLHVFLVLRRLKAEGRAGREAGQALFDVMFDDMDRSLREMGVGDFDVGKRVKAMARSFYGRLAAYEEALTSDDAVLEAALRRNLFGTVEPAGAHLAALAGYMRCEATALEAQKGGDIIEGRVSFGAPPEPA